MGAIPPARHPPLPGEWSTSWHAYYSTRTTFPFFREPLPQGYFPKKGTPLYKKGTHWHIRYMPPTKTPPSWFAVALALTALSFLAGFGCLAFYAGEEYEAQHHAVRCR